MKTEDFLDILEARDLVPQSIVKQLRSKVAQGERRLTAKSVLKYLVKKELVTRNQAKQLLESTLAVTPHAESSILGIMPAPKARTEKPKRSVDQKDIPTLDPVEPGSRKSKQKKPSAPDPIADDLGSLSASLASAEASDPFTKMTAREVADPGSFKKLRGKKKGRKNEWDSSLLLLGGGGLVVLVLAGVIIGFLIYREDADAVLAEAGSFFDGGSYRQSIKQYEHFVETWPSHTEHGAAKVKLGLARIWKETNSTSDFTGALKVAQSVLDNIKDETEFNTAQRVLSSRLPVIAQGLANQAEKTKDSAEINDLVEQANTALALCVNTKYIPKTFRDDVVLGEIQQTLDRVKRTQQQNVALSQALEAIQVAIDQSDTTKAYAIHRKLLEENAGLLGNETLVAKVKEVSAAEQKVVRFVGEAKQPEENMRPNNVLASLAMAERRGEPAAGVEGTFAVRIGGAVYGLRAGDGAFLWRQDMGVAPHDPAVALPDGKILVVDATNYELLKLGGVSGKVEWRLTFDDPISQPVVFGQQLLVADLSGKLHLVDLASGERSGFVQFGQPLPMPPVVNSEGTRIYVVGEHSSLYTLSAEDFSCLGVFYVGHSLRSISVPPVTVLSKVIVAVNTGVATSQVLVIGTDSDGLPTELDNSRRLVGLVNTPFLRKGRRLVALTSRGQVTVFEVSSAEGDEALTQIATRDPERGDPVARFGLLHDGHVWVAGKELNKLAVLPTGNRLPVKDTDNDYSGDTFDHALQTVGDLLIHVRRPRRKAGAIVAAMETGSGKALWETELAVPLAGAPVIDEEQLRIVAVTASGAAYTLDRQAMSRRVQDQSEHLTVGRRALPPLEESVNLGQGRLALATVGATRMMHFRPGDSAGELDSPKLASPLSCSPVAWRDGFVVPTTGGQVFFFAGESAEQMGTPFQPALKPGVEYHWLTPAPFHAGDDSLLVLSDGVEKIFTLTFANDPEPHLEAIAESDVGTSPLNTRFVVLGKNACAGTMDGRIAVFGLPGLGAKSHINLAAEITWGPFEVDDFAVLVTDTDELVGLDSRAQIAWRQPLAHGPAAGMPVVVDGALFVAWQTGGLSRIALADGSETEHLPLRQSITAGPVPFGNRMVVASSDGTLLVVDRP